MKVLGDLLLDPNPDKPMAHRLVGEDQIQAGIVQIEVVVIGGVALAV